MSPGVASSGTSTMAPHHGAAGLVIEGVAKRWGKSTVLEDIDLSLARGTVTSISGGNGAGKTTLLRVMAGMIVPDRGTVSLDGLRPDSDRPAFQAQIGFLAAGNSGLYARLSVRRNLEFWSALAFVPVPERREAVSRALERFALTELQSRRADRLSLGQRQRVRLALTFLHDPRLVLLDEPSANLDEEGVAALLAAIGDHTRRGGISVWCAPTPQTDVSCDRAYALRGGRLEPA